MRGIRQAPLLLLRVAVFDVVLLLIKTVPRTVASAVVAVQRAALPDCQRRQTSAGAEFSHGNLAPRYIQGLRDDMKAIVLRLGQACFHTHSHACLRDSVRVDLSLPLRISPHPRLQHLQISAAIRPSVLPRS
eukprot:5379104-Pleurochrysis_carterae.AAC.1